MKLTQIILYSFLTAVISCSTTDVVEESTAGLAVREPAVLELTDGSMLEGQVVHASPTEMTIETVGGTTRTIVRGEVDPMSWYRVRSAGTDLTIDDRLELGRFALENGLFEAAEMELSHAAEIAPDKEGEIARILRSAREGHATSLAERSERAFASGDTVEATRRAGEVLTRFPETKAAGRAQNLVVMMNADLGESEPTEINLVADRGADRRLKDAEKYVTRGQKRNLTALRETGSKAGDAFEGSSDDYQRAISLLDKALMSSDLTPEQNLRAQELRHRATEEAVDVQINLARMYVNRGSYPQAVEVMDGALELDPENERALTYRKQVEFVSDEAARIRKLGRKTNQKLRYGPAS